mmetsp:Transcript_88133/g.247902  ORF Transcript_88133/g.247902 Transcript_88133/m.247902 type:complete len:614 (-) Transcript_88133:134-1975(-)
MSSTTSRTGLEAEECWSRCGRDAAVWFSCPGCRGPAPSTAQVGSTRYLLCRQCADSWLCPFCNRAAEVLDIRTDSDAASTIQTVTTLITTTPSAAALRRTLGSAPSVHGSVEASASGASGQVPRAVFSALVAECQEHRQSIARLEAENEALRQQIEALQGAASDKVFEERISTILGHLVELPNSLLQSVPAGPLSDYTRDTLIRMLFDRFDYKGRCALCLEEASDLSQALGRGPMTRVQFEELCNLSGASVASGLQVDHLTRLYDASNRAPYEDLSAVLRVGKKWRISWAMFIDIVLKQMDDASGGRYRPYEGILIPGDQQPTDTSPLFMNMDLSPDALLDRLQRDMEELQSLFYEWVCWLRQHCKSISIEDSPPSWSWNTTCPRCGASPEALSSEFVCLGCGGGRCFARPFVITGIPKSQARRIEELHQSFMELVAGLGYKLHFESAVWEAFALPLSRLRAAPPLSKKLRPGMLAPRSLLHRLLVRASEVSSARARFSVLQSCPGKCRFFEMSRDDFLAGRLAAWKVDHGISEESHQQLGPKDATSNYVPQPTTERVDSISWPLSYWFYSRELDISALAVPPCSICGRIFSRDEDLTSHQSSHSARAWAFEC